MTPAREVDELLANEVERRLRWLDEEPRPELDVRAALHSLRGASALAGYPELSLVLAQLSHRVQNERAGAIAEVTELLRHVHERLVSGLPPFATRWPEPPPSLEPSSVDPRYRAEYLDAVGARLVELDGATAKDAAEGDVLERAYRSVHAIKGAAGAVGDDVMAWYCHGLETLVKEQLRGAGGDVLGSLARHRMIIASLLDHPAAALQALCAAAEAQRRAEAPRSAYPISVRPRERPVSERPRRAASPKQGEDDGAEADFLLRVPPSSVDRFSERLERVDLIHKELFSAAEIAREVAARQREVSSSLLEALRLMSAREAWGPPAPAVERITRAVKDARVTAAAADRGAALCRRNAESLHALVSRMQAELAAVRRTSVASLFQRVARAVERIATQEGRRVRVHLEGGEVPIDRRAAEQLLEPLLQLARNAVAHGILRPEQRRSLGKPEEGIVAIVAERAGDWLRIIVEDDGSGIDVERVRTLAIERGLLEAERASIASDEELLELLFAPGLTTQTGADFLAGRGVGLDLAQEAAHRMGGAIRLAQRPGGGLSATLEVPLASGMVDVVWLKVGGHRFALPVINSGRVREPDQASLLLAECLGIARAAPPKAALELRIASAQPLTLGVDEVGEIEEVAIRPIPDLIARAGPYTGAVLRPDGSLALVLDAALLAARAWCRATQST